MRRWRVPGGVNECQPRTYNHGTTNTQELIFKLRILDSDSM